MNQIRCYECVVKGTEWHRQIHATSPGKAKREYWRDIHESWEDVPFTAIRVRVVGPPQTSDAFRRTAEYRGVPFARVGMAVKVGEWNGRIIGNNASANFDILFDDGPHAGLTLNCHPNWEMRFFAEDGSEVRA